MLTPTLLLALAPALQIAPAPTPPGGSAGSGAPTDSFYGQSTLGERAQTQSASLVDYLPPWDDGTLGLEADPVVLDQDGSGSTWSLADLDVVSTLIANDLPGSPRTFEVELTNTGTGYKEKFLIQYPKYPSHIVKSPLLVVFHKFGTTHFDVTVNTSFQYECAERGWFLLAPLGASTKSFSSLPSQNNVEIVLDYIDAKLGQFIDSQRLYAIGFSMGASNALNFAARHRDPSQPNMFAAAINHTGGGIALKHTYQSDPAIQWILEFWHGGTPAQEPFSYARSSLIDFNTFTQQINRTNDLGRNVVPLPILSVRAVVDPIGYAVVQNLAFEFYMDDLGGDLETIIIEDAFEHTWDTLDNEMACDWLAQHTLEIPTKGNPRADRHGIWYRFDIVQDAPGEFTPFSWNVDSDANRIRMTGTKNLASWRIAPAAHGIDTTQPFDVVMNSRDGLPDTGILEGFPVPPVSVLRDGVPASVSHDGVTETVTIVETDGGLHTWTVTMGT